MKKARAFSIAAALTIALSVLAPSVSAAGLHGTKAVLDSDGNITAILGVGGSLYTLDDQLNKILVSTDVQDAYDGYYYKGDKLFSTLTRKAVLSNVNGIFGGAVARTNSSRYYYMTFDIGENGVKAVKLTGVTKKIAAIWADNDWVFLNTKQDNEFPRYYVSVYDGTLGYQTLSSDGQLSSYVVDAKGKMTPWEE